MSSFRYLLPFFVFCLHNPLSAQEVQWFKGNTHAHSLWSDGDDFPEMISDWYVRNGYQFLGISDHNILARGDRWMSEEAIEKKRRGIGRRVTDKYRARFGEEWVETRIGEDGKPEIRLRTFEEYRSKFEKDGKFLLVEAEEISAKTQGVPIHINAINPADTIPPISDLGTVREVLRANLQAIAAHAVESGQPILVHINHPNFRWALTAEDLAHVIEGRFFEVFNGHPMVYNDGHPERVESSMERLWDVANTIRLGELNAPPLYGLATDDSHTYHGGDVSPGRGWVMVRAEKLEAGALIEAMQKGQFYGSSGVTLKDVRFDEDSRTLRVEIEPEEGVTFQTRFVGTKKGYDRAVEKVATPEGDHLPYRLRYSEDVGAELAVSESLTPSYTLMDDDMYVRAVITSSRVAQNPIEPGQLAKAWTQPVGWERVLKTGEKKRVLRVLSYNIHHGQGVDGEFDLERIAKTIADVEPDLVAIQEIEHGARRSRGVNQPKELARLTGMEVVFGPAIAFQGGEYGNAVLSKLPIKRHENHALPRIGEGEKRGVLEVEVELPDGQPMRFLATHLDSKEEPERVLSAETILKMIEPASDELAILAGDLNAVPESKSMATLRKMWAMPNEEPTPTVPVSNPVRQIDYVLVRPANRWKTIEVRVLEEKVASDHRAILAVLEWLDDP